VSGTARLPGVDGMAHLATLVTTDGRIHNAVPLAVRWNS
jgi:hypothetical protein